MDVLETVRDGQGQPGLRLGNCTEDDEHQIFEALRLSGPVTNGSAGWQQTFGGRRCFGPGQQRGPLPLSDVPLMTPWDPSLAARMTRSGVAIHEESILETLLGDLLDSPGHET